jgi:hypothetical protein
MLALAAWSQPAARSRSVHGGVICSTDPRRAGNPLRRAGFLAC